MDTLVIFNLHTKFLQPANSYLHNLMAVTTHREPPDVKLHLLHL